MVNVRHVSAPMPYKDELYSDDTLLSEQEHKEYRSIVGSLVYYTGLRYDIAHDVNRLSQKVSQPTKGSMKALRRVLAYLACTTDKQLKVCRVKGDIWHIYSDSDHAGDKESGDCRSRTGVMILLNGMPIHWRSNKQPKTSLSSASAEIYAMSEACRDAQLRLWVAEEAGRKVNWPVKINVDNAAGESFQHATCAASKLKGIFDMREMWIKELQDETRFNAVHIDTKKNLADMFTKCLTYPVRKVLEDELDRIAISVANGKS